MDFKKLATAETESKVLSPAVQKWVAELDAAEKREKEWRKEAGEYVELYETGKQDANPFNILFSNTETIAPALYNATPRPDVKRRFKDADPLAAHGAKVLERLISYYLDNTVGSYTPFDALMNQSVVEALVPGRGVVRFKYDAELAKSQDTESESEDSDEASEAAETITYEAVCGETVPWNRFRMGYARTWAQVPWIAFEHFMTRQELKDNFGEEIAGQVKLTVKGGEDCDDEPADAEDVNFAQVFEIWDKTSKRVLFVSPGLPGQFVKETEDPLGLSGFFPCPEPLGYFAKISSMIPVPLYNTYKGQAKELNRITVRIDRIISALKVRGFYDSTVEGMQKVMTAEDNTLIPAENVAALQNGQSLEKAIWLMPLEKLITVLQQLYVQRQQVKDVIYEITGVSDIIRGASAASETATAQNIKNQWGTLRLKRWQKRTAEFVRNSLRIVAEISVTKLSQPTIGGRTGPQYPTAEQKMQIQQIAQQAAVAQQPLPPEMQEVMALPTWEDILGMLKNDLQRTYRVDIETNSTVDVEATEDKKDVGEYLNAAAQFLNGTAPMVKEGILPFDLVKHMLLAVTRRYRFGTEIEDKLQNIGQQPQGQQGQQQQAQAQAEVQQAQADAQMKQQEAQLTLQVAQAKAQAELQTLQLRRQVEELKAKAEIERIQRESALGEAKAQAEIKKLQMQAVTQAQAAAQSKRPAKSGGITTS